MSATIIMCIMMIDNHHDDNHHNHHVHRSGRRCDAHTSHQAAHHSDGDVWLEEGCRYLSEKYRRRCVRVVFPAKNSALWNVMWEQSLKITVINETSETLNMINQMPRVQLLLHLHHNLSPAGTGWVLEREAGERWSAEDFKPCCHLSHHHQSLKI